MCICTMCVPGACEVRKGHQIYPLEVKLCMVKGHRMLLCKNKCFQLLAHLSSLSLFLILKIHLPTSKVKTTHVSHMCDSQSTWIGPRRSRTFQAAQVIHTAFPPCSLRSMGFWVTSSCLLEAPEMFVSLEGRRYSVSLKLQYPIPFYPSSKPSGPGSKGHSEGLRSEAREIMWVA